jgi:hypothetical protein
MNVSIYQQSNDFFHQIPSITHDIHIVCVTFLLLLVHIFNRISVIVLYSHVIKFSLASQH